MLDKILNEKKAEFLYQSPMGKVKTILWLEQKKKKYQSPMGKVKKLAMLEDKEIFGVSIPNGKGKV